MDEIDKNTTIEIDEDIYRRMLNSSATLVEYIRKKHEKGLFVSKEESKFVIDFEEYFLELNRVLDEMGIE